MSFNRPGSQAPIDSAIASLKSLVTIVCGLAGANAVIRLMEPTRAGDGTYSVERIETHHLVLFIVVILAVLRFYHGNIRQLDRTYTEEPGKGGSGDGLLFGRWQARARWQVALDFFIIVGESFALAFLSFLITSPQEFVTGYGILLLVDALWFWGVHDQRAESEQGKGWMLNNLLFGTVLLILMSSQVANKDLEFTDGWVYSTFAMMLVNCLTDIVLARRLYFPEPNGAPARTEGEAK
jgi:hypothetical protein